jgi:hypothetical protein
MTSSTDYFLSMMGDVHRHDAAAVVTTQNSNLVNAIVLNLSRCIDREVAQNQGATDCDANAASVALASVLNSTGPHELLPAGDSSSDCLLSYSYDPDLGDIGRMLKILVDAHKAWSVSWRMAKHEYHSNPIAGGVALVVDSAVYNRLVSDRIRSSDKFLNALFDVFPEGMPWHSELAAHRLHVFSVEVMDFVRSWNPYAPEPTLELFVRLSSGRMLKVL